MFDLDTMRQRNESMKEAETRHIREILNKYKLVKTETGEEKVIDRKKTPENKNDQK